MKKALLNELALLCATESTKNGWDYNELPDHIIKMMRLTLIHAEVSEAVEAIRKPGKMDKHLPHRSAEEVEITDILIRVLGYAGYHGIDLEGTMKEKIEYNRTRADRNDHLV